MKVCSCAKLPVIPLTGIWYRAFQLRHLKTALATKHSAATPSRYSDGSGKFELLYLGEDFQTILYEAQAQLGTPYGSNVPVSNPGGAWIHVSVQIRLSRIVDLCDTRNQKILSTSVQELTGDWRGYGLRGQGLAPTQNLGLELFNMGNIEGFMSYSARVCHRKALIIFPQHLQPGSLVECTFNDGKKFVQHQIP